MAWGCSCGAKGCKPKRPGMKLLIAQGNVPPDPEGDKITASLARRYGLTNYDEYLKRLAALDHPPGFKYPWPAGFAPKKRKVTWDGKPFVSPAERDLQRKMKEGNEKQGLQGSASDRQGTQESGRGEDIPEARRLDEGSRQAAHVSKRVAPLGHQASRRADVPGLRVLVLQ